MSSHKPGSLKQSNKKHKGPSGKRAQNRSFGEGRIASTSIKAKTNNAANAINERQNRINRSVQLKKQKAANSWLQKRIGSSQSCPKVVGIISLSDAATSTACLEQCLAQSKWHSNNDNLAQSTITNCFYSAHKTRCTFLKSVDRDIFGSIDIAKLADILLFVVDADNVSGDATIIDELGLKTLSALKALGFPESLFCVVGLEGNNSKANQSRRKAILQKLEQETMLSEVRLLEASNSAQLVRAICNATPKTISWRASRSYVISEAVTVQQSLESQGSGTASGKCSVQVSGYLRGAPMSVHSLMHIVGVGTGRVASVWAATQAENHARDGKLSSATFGPLSVPPIALCADPSRQDSLVVEAAVDTILGEQTWPSEAEMLAESTFDLPDADKNAGRSRRTITAKIPVGMSSYQADWFQDEEGHADFNATVTGHPDEEEEEEEAAPLEAQEEDEEGDDMSLDSAPDQNRTLNSRANKQQLRAVLAQEDKEFPDEMQTPDDIAARQRFARYRALQSFRASPWHPKENLPQDYAKIFQFENFMGTQRRVLSDSKAVEHLQQSIDLSSAKSAKSLRSADSVVSSAAALREDQMDQDSEGEEDVVMETTAPTATATHDNAQQLTVRGADDFIRSGQFVHIVLEEVPAEVAARLAQHGYLALFGMHQHENKLSVLHFSVQRCPGNDELIKSKDPLVFQVGFRSFVTKPVFSESNLNCDKHKFERFLLNDRFSMASCFGPISYSPCPLLVFKKSPLTGQLELVATGSLSSVDPDRIMLKKIILTGIPIRVRKKYAVVKHMFYEPTDVRWFKPAELVTKHGLRGHIREPIGTHGLLKAYFSGPITQNDTVMLILYKRVFPKFPEEGLVIQ